MRFRMRWPTAMPPMISEGLVAYSASVTALDAAETTQSLARTEVERADRNLRRQLTKVYGVLVTEVGKASADRFFPKSARNKSDDTAG